MIIYDKFQEYFYSSLINDKQYFSAFGTRKWGDGKNQDTLTNFLSKQQIPVDKIVSLEQVHSANIREVFSFPKTLWEKIPECDGVITRSAHVVLTVITADCIPIVFVDKKNGLLGISHQGWRGSIKKMAVKIAKYMISQGAGINNLRISIGPSIGDCCYTVEEDRYYEFMEEFDNHSHQIFFTRGGKIHLNLALLNYLLLLECGIPKEHIDFFPFCTCCDTNRFFSFRRDKPKHTNFERTFNTIIKLYD